LLSALEDVMARRAGVVVWRHRMYISLIDVIAVCVQVDDVMLCHVDSAAW